MISILVLTLFAQIPPKTPQAVEAQNTEEPALPLPPVQVASKDTSRDNLKKMLRDIAWRKGMSESTIEQIETTIQGGVSPLCPSGESNWNPNAVGDHGTSFGLAQIHLPAHPGITKEQALDPEFALNFITDQFIKGNEWMWTCWKVVYDK